MLHEVLTSELTTFGIVSKKAEPNVAIPMQDLTDLASEVVVVERGSKSPSTMSHGFVAKTTETFLCIPHPLVFFGCDSAKCLELSCSVASTGLLWVGCTEMSPSCFALVSFLFGVGFVVPARVEHETLTTPGTEPIMSSFISGEGAFTTTTSAGFHGYNIIPVGAS